MTNRSCTIETITDTAFAERVLESEQPVLVLVNGRDGGPRLPKALDDCMVRVLKRLAIVRLNAPGCAVLPESLRLCPQGGLAVFSQGALTYCFAGEPSRGDLDDLLRCADRLPKVKAELKKPTRPGLADPVCLIPAAPAKPASITR